MRIYAHTQTQRRHALKHVHMRAFYTRTRTRTRIRMHTHTKNTREEGRRAQYPPCKTHVKQRVKQPHIQNTLARHQDTRIHRYPPSCAIKTRTGGVAPYTARAPPAHRARSGAPTMSRATARLLPVSLSRRAPSQPPLRPRAAPARRGDRQAAVATQTHNDVHTHAGRRARTHAHEHAPTTGAPTSLGDGYCGRRARGREQVPARTTHTRESRGHLRHVTRAGASRWVPARTTNLPYASSARRVA